MSPDQSPRSHVEYLREKVLRLRSLLMDLKVIEAELERQREELARQQAARLKALVWFWLIDET
jgi:hypothetical protein